AADVVSVVIAALLASLLGTGRPGRCARGRRGPARASALRRLLGRLFGQVELVADRPRGRSGRGTVLAATAVPAVVAGLGSVAGHAGVGLVLTLLTGGPARLLCLTARRLRLADLGDEIALAHPGGALEAEPAGEGLQFRKPHGGQRAPVVRGLTAGGGVDGFCHEVPSLEVC